MLKHTYSHGFTTNFEHIIAKQPKTQKFTLIYTHGFCSDPWGRKPEEIKKWCIANNINFYRHELAGHGSDWDNIEKTDINIWKEQILDIIDHVITGPVVLAGASLGGWLSLLGAEARPQRVVGVMGLAAAPDFTVDNEQYQTPELKAIMERDGKLAFEESGFKFVITKQLIESGYPNLLLTKKQIGITCPMVLIQGMKDESVHWQKAVTIAQKVKSENVLIKLLKNSDHRLNDDADIEQIRSGLDFLNKMVITA